MEYGGTGLLRVLLDVSQSRLPDFIHLTRDRLWVADLALQDSGGTALELQCFDLDGKECLHETLYRMDADCPAPYCWFTDNAVVLFHAPEDPADPEEDTAVTLRWFPLDTLEEQVWRVEPGQLPGELTGVIRHWNRGEVLTVQAAFRKGDDVRTAYVSFDLPGRSLAVTKPGLLGALGKKDPQPPEYVPNPERLCVDEKLIGMINSGITLPDGTFVLPTAVQADERYCRVECTLIPPDANDLDGARTEVYAGPHCGFLFPLTIDGYRCVLIAAQPSVLLLPCVDLKGPFPGQETTKDQPIMTIEGKILEVERDFADAHLTRSCREEALYCDERCYRWQFYHAAWAVPFELPAFFASNSYPLYIQMLSTYCGSYMNRARRNGDWDITFDTLLSLWIQNYKASLTLLKDLPAYKLIPLGLDCKNSDPSPSPED